VQQICPWSLLPHIKPVGYEGAKLESKSLVAQHIVSLEIVGANEGALLRERVAGASSLVCTGLKTLGSHLRPFAVLVFFDGFYLRQFLQIS